uniref:Uncharacterized protein n=1 Tax=Rhizophora mucronata TaxID=61149 RepID=A0A2P2QG42_RHIMU
MLSLCTFTSFLIFLAWL